MTSEIHPRLGAVELIELGSAHPPMIRNYPKLGEGGGITDFFGNVLSTGFSTIGDVVDVPLGALSSGVDWVFTSLAGVLKNIPILGEIVAGLLLVIDSVLKFALAIPGFLLHELGNAFKGLSGSFDKAFPIAEQVKKLVGAKDALVDRAPAGIRNEVAQKLGSGESTVIKETVVEEGGGLGEISGETVLIVGAAAAAAALVLS